MVDQQLFDKVYETIDEIEANLRLRAIKLFGSVTREDEQELRQWSDRVTGARKNVIYAARDKLTTASMYWSLSEWFKAMAELEYVVSRHEGMAT
jgi:hypothetical protein